MKKFLPPAISLIAILAITQGDSSALMSLLIAGVIPGTAIVIPFWVMIIIYCFIFSAIVALYIEDTRTTLRTNRTVLKRRQQLPRHRFSQI